MFGRGPLNARMRGRNDGGAQRRRVLATVISVVLVFSLISLYHGSFFSNRGAKVDPSASGWAANLAAGIRGESGTSGELNAAKADAYLREVRDEVDVRVDEDVEGKEEVAAEKDPFAEKLGGNEEESGDSESGGSASEEGAPKSFPVSVRRCIVFWWEGCVEMEEWRWDLDECVRCRPRCDAWRIGGVRGDGGGCACIVLFRCGGHVLSQPIWYRGVCVCVCVWIVRTGVGCVGMTCSVSRRQA